MLDFRRFDYETARVVYSGCQEMHVHWDLIEGKKRLFLDSAELPLTQMKEQEAIAFIHHSIHKFQMDVIAVFCFLKETVPPRVEKDIQHLLNQTIFL